MAANDSRAIPIRGYKYSRVVTFVKLDGTVVSAALTGLAAKTIAPDGTTTALTAPTEIGSGQGSALIELTAAQSDIQSSNIVATCSNTDAVAVVLPFDPVHLLASRSGTVTAGTTTTATLATLPAAVATNQLRGTLLAFTNGPAAGEVREIASNTSGTTPVVTVEAAYSGAPASGNGYIQGQISAFELDAAVTTDIAGAVLNAVLASYTQAGSVGERLGRIPNAAAGANGGLPTVDANARVSANVTAMAANTVNASALATDAVTEIQTGLATAAALSTVAGYVDTEVAAILAAVDTEVAAIKAKTDSLTFTKALELDVNIQSVNDVTVVGNGAGTPWGP